MSWATPVVNHNAAQGFYYSDANRIEADIAWLAGSDYAPAESTSAATAYALVKRDASGGASFAGLVASSLSVSGTVTAGGLALSGNIAVATSRFTVDAGTGNVAIAGTLAVSGAITAASFGGATISGGAFSGFGAAVSGALSGGFLFVTGAITGQSLALAGASISAAGAISGQSLALAGASISAAGAISGSSLSLGLGSISAANIYAAGTVFTGNGIGEGGLILKRKIIEIGDWNMDMTSNRDIAHGIYSITAIHSVTVLIRDDADVRYIPLNIKWITNMNAFDEGWWVDGTYVNLRRTAGGWFDNANYDSTSFNRGWIEITYTA